MIFGGQMLASSWQLVAASLISAPLVAQLPPVAADSGVTHAARVEALRAKAKEQIQQDRLLYSESQIQDLEARYQSAHQDAFPMLLRRDAGPILVDLIAAYPKSNRSGCAVLKLARLASGKEERERYLKEGIATHSGAWCESGVQVGALARALLAVQYAGSGKLDEAERLAKELLTLFPGAIDESGAPLDDVLEGIRLLRGRDPPRSFEAPIGIRQSSIRESAIKNLQSSLA
jgi:hypothetical protein